MQYSPKLKMAMEEIKAIIKKHDIAAAIVIHTPGHSEYLNALNPSYSCMEYGGRGKVTFKTKSSHYGGDKKKRDQMAKDTSNMLHAIGMTAGQQAMTIIELSKFFDDFIKAEHTNDGHTSHDQQNQ